MDEDLVDGPGRQRWVVRTQFQPIAGSVVIEARGIERAFVEWTLASSNHLLPVTRRHELVDVVEAFVIAHIDDHAIVLSNHHFGTLVFDATECSSLDGFCLWILRVDLHHPTEAIDFVLVARLSPVKTLVILVPVVAEPVGIDAVAGFLGAGLPGTARRAEVSVEVFLTREIRAPRGVAIRTVVHRSEWLVAGGVHQEITLGGRSTEFHRSVHVNTTIALVSLQRPSF